MGGWYIIGYVLLRLKYLNRNPCISDIILLVSYLKNKDSSYTFQIIHSGGLQKIWYHQYSCIKQQHLLLGIYHFHRGLIFILKLERLRFPSKKISFRFPPEPPYGMVTSFPNIIVRLANHLLRKKLSSKDKVSSSL